MNCPRCNTPSPEGKNYCADCGTPLNITLTYLEGFVTKQIKESLDAKFKDQKLVEMETAQAVVERVYGWSKLFAYFIAIPLALLLVGFSIAGIRKYEDFTGLVRGAEAQIKPRLEQANASSEAAKQQADEAQRKAEGARKTVESELKSASGVADKVQTLSTKFSELEQQTSLQMKGAGERVDKQMVELDKRIDAAMKDIAEQQRKLASTNELVKSLFSKGKTEYFDTKTKSAKLVTIPASKNTLVLLLLAQTPIRETLDFKWHVFSQPKNSYGVLRGNLVYFNWGDPLESLGQHPLEVTYVPDTTDTTTIFKSLSVKDNAVYADDTVVFNAPASK
jgi:F0F1-type ATP synthase membrane subunit b/b'